MVRMNDAEIIILENFDDQNISFIFPSEITAAFWRIHSLKITGKKAVNSGRFLSWDTFKERYFLLNQRGTPVNKIVRTLFTLSLLEKNSVGEPVLSYFVPPRFAGSSLSFKKLVLSILPRLSGFISILKNGTIHLPDGMVKDIFYINQTYVHFMEERGFFEPGWMKADISGLNDTFYLFYPEVITDYAEFVQELSQTDKIRPVLLKEITDSGILRFSTSTVEIKWLLRRIGDLLDSGVPPDDIAVTLPDMEGWRYKLESMAALRDIPLSFKQGKAVSDYPGAHFFRLLSDCGRKGFSSIAVKQLLLNGAYPWKEKSTAEDLVLFGIENHCFQNYHLEGEEKDVWLTALNKRGPENLKIFYRNLKRSLSSMSHAKNFSSIKKEIQKFVGVFLDTEQMESKKIVKEFQFALEILNNCVAAEEKCGGLSVSSPYDIWLYLLDESIYVPRDNEGGISVYPYRVSGGITPLWHFIPGYSQRVSSIVEEAYPFLREDQKDFFADSVRDFTDSFLQLYSLSGENVIFTMSRDSFSGPEIPPAGFIIKNTVTDFLQRVPEVKDMYEREKAFWNGETDEVPFIVPVMKKGLKRAVKTVFSGKEIDFTRQTVMDEDLRQILYSHLMKGRKTFDVSSTMLDTFYFCPYSFFLQRILSLQQPDYQSFFKDHMFIGNLIHECMNTLFLFIDKETVVFDPEKTDIYKEYIPVLTDTVMMRHENEGETMIRPVWEETRHFLTAHLLSFIDREAVQFPYFSLIAAEKEYSVLCDTGDIQLKGRIDRISGDKNTRSIIDYKKNYRLSFSHLNPKEGPPESFQLFFYIFLAESEGIPVNNAHYYDFTKNKYITVFADTPGKKVISRESVDTITGEMKKYITRMKDRIESGDFSVKNCDSCNLRNICRIKYTVR